MTGKRIALAQPRTTAEFETDQAVFNTAHQALLDTVEALRVHFAPAFERLSRDLAKVQAEIEAEEHRRQHPRITDNLHKLHRRYRRRP